MLASEDVRLWVTGVGVTSALGDGADATFRSLVSGRTAIGPVTLFDAGGYRSTIAAEVARIAPETNARGEAVSRTSRMALTAAREALDHAALLPRTRVGLVIGGTTGGMFENEALLAALHADESKRDAPNSMLAHPLTATGDWLAKELGPFAEIRTLCSACSSGANALATAAHWLLTGAVDAVVAGGADALCRLTFSGFNALASLDVDPCKPFDVGRRGLTLGEGAAFLVLERSAAARARNKQPIAEFVGHAMGAEAHHITNPEASGATVARLVGSALRRASLPVAMLDYVNAHGTGTPLNDAMEARGLAQAFGPDIERIPVSSSKGQIGHTLGAAGAIEAVIAALTIRDQMLVPTIGLHEVDPECRLVHVREKGRSARVRSALSNSFGFGGMDGVVVFAEPELCPPKRTTRRSVVVTGASALTTTGLFSNEGIAEASRTAHATSSLAAGFDSGLDVGRARRLDRPARLGVVAAQSALSAAVGTNSSVDPTSLGVVLGSAFGSVDASAAFMHRLFEKGARLASPAEFPNLVPSSPVGHVSIYLGARGPVFAVADLSASGECAILEAFGRITVGDAPRMIAGAFEEQSSIVDRVLGGRFDVAADAHTELRSEGAAAVVLEDEAEARDRGARALARFVWGERRENFEGLVESAPRPSSNVACVVVPRVLPEHSPVLERSAWSTAKFVSVAPFAGEHEGAGAHAVAVAVSMIAAGEVRSALVLGRGPHRAYALVFEAP